jgi:hypothetical protein
MILEVVSFVFAEKKRIFGSISQSNQKNKQIEFSNSNLEDNMPKILLSFIRLISPVISSIASQTEAA